MTTPQPKENEFLGATDDFFWYETTQMAEQLRTLASRFENMERVLKARSREQSTYFQHLESKIQGLKAEIELLRSKHG
jgi:uncharacterized protein YlxW (UPF0749 family)